jgi:(2Fe-2S) ferredoxin
MIRQRTHSIRRTGLISSGMREDFIEDREKLLALAPVAAAPIKHHVFVCTGKSCSARDSAEVLEAFENNLKERGLLFGREAKGKNPHGRIIVTSCASVGFCSIGPAVMVYPDGVWYAQVKAADVAEIIEEHLLNNRVVERLALAKIPAEDRSAATETNSAWDA